MTASPAPTTITGTHSSPMSPMSPMPPSTPLPFPSPRRRIAVIGCGPGGISFLHAMAARKAALVKAGDEEGLASLPIVTVYERSSSPGGVWRAEADANDANAGDASDGVNVNAVDANGAGNDAALTLAATKTNEEEEEEAEEGGTDESSDSDSDNSSAASNSDNAMDEYYSNYIIQQNTKSSTSMYEALWTNGPSQGIEFYDYTFDDHFHHCPTPIFMPRKQLLEYMLARVTKNNPTIFEDHVEFNSTVENVTYDEVDKTFEIYYTTKTIAGAGTGISAGAGTAVAKTKERKSAKFDTCIWAAGENGCAKIPRSIHTILTHGSANGNGNAANDGNPNGNDDSNTDSNTNSESNSDSESDPPVPFKGFHAHSSQAAGKLIEFIHRRILLIGDGLSAEDLALQAIKLGVQKVFILARSGDGVCSETSSWPKKAVRVIHSMVVQRVIDGGTGIRLVEREYNPLKGEMMGENEKDIDNDNENENGDKEDREEPRVYDLKDIAAVIYCTGYHPNHDMIDASTDPTEEEEVIDSRVLTGKNVGTWDDNDANVNSNSNGDISESDSSEDDDDDDDDSEDETGESETETKWKMEPHALTSELGEIKPYKDLYVNCDEYISLIPGYFRGISLHNPNIMYLSEETADYPLFEIDVRAWYMAAVILGEVNLPTIKEAENYMTNIVKEGMQLHYVRSYMDINYKRALYDLECKIEDEMDSDHWSYYHNDPRVIQFEEEAMDFTMRRFAQEMKDANYPVQLGSLQELNDKGKLLSKMTLKNNLQRRRIAKKTSWETFRDLDPEGFVSIHTGTPAAPLKARWIDIDDSDPYPHLLEEFVEKLQLGQK